MTHEGSDGLVVDAAVRRGSFLLEASLTAAPGASVIFQTPATRNSAAISTAAVQLTHVFHPGNSKPASSSPRFDGSGLR